MAHSFEAERYPITASNHTYILLLSYPSSGTGTPQDMSLVMALSFKPDSRNEVVKFFTLGFQWSCRLTHSIRSWLKALNFRKKCSVSRKTGVLSQSRCFMFIRSFGSNVFPHPSHWSPLAPSKLQLGHMPSTYLSARKRS